MTVDELCAAVVESARRGTIGVPVALRISVQFPVPHADPYQGCVAALKVAEAAFTNLQLARIYAQRESQGRQLSVLASCVGGETLFVTAGCGCAEKPSLDLILVGNRGMVRLEGGELFKPERPGERSGSVDNAIGLRWREMIERSLKTQTAVDVDA